MLSFSRLVGGLSVAFGLVLLCVATVCSSSFPTVDAAEKTPSSVPDLQPLARPVAMAYNNESEQLLVANRDSATLVTVDPVAKQVSGTWRVPEAANLTDLIVSADGQLALVCSSASNRIWLLKRLAGGQFTVLQTLDVPVGPVGLCWIPKQQQAALSCQWARTVLILNVAPAALEGERLSVQCQIPLPHSPRRLLSVQNGQRLVVADQFSGILSLIDIVQGKLERTVKIPGQNIHGLTISKDGRQVILAHQILNQVAETSHDAVFWGIVMSNTLRIIPLNNLLDAQRQPLMQADIHFLGEPNHGAADPTDVTLGINETLLTTLGGVDELAIGVHLDHSFDRVKVGRHPVAVVTNAEGNLAFVANQFSDSVSIVEVQTRKNLGEISLHGALTPREPTLVEQGEALFHSGRLSLDRWYSCHSCHSSGHTVGLLNDNFGDGNYGAPKSIPSLLGLAETPPFLWSGQDADLNLQTRKSITTTMHGEDPSEAEVEQLVAYLRTLAPPPKVLTADPAQIARGAKIFEAHDCARCHTPPTYTSAETYDVGLQDQHGRKKFNPPSLRGLRYRGPYFHDHRAETLKDVFMKHKHPSESSWKEEEIGDLMAFLEGL
ncbi:MAG: cytochrome c peroxidase [Planctomycetaceae bacterium]|nr:cytochrome c peroxidase [Planctomycetaceae bacterium]